MTEKNTQTGFEIAVIGMAGKFPGSKDIDEFWENLKNGSESLGFLTKEEVAEAGVDSELLENPNYVMTTGGELEEKELFDASFFGYTPAEAELMDPQFRLFHQCAWHALEHAGYDPYSYDGAIGLYAGAGQNLDWHAKAILTGKQEEMGQFVSSLLTGRDFMCTRISYKLNLQGPSFILQSACSTSLLAIHTACRALLMKECDIAMAGGASVNSGDNYGYVYQEGMILSPDGHCRAFDANAAGIAGGSGVGIVVLKRLKFALRDRDTIHAVILASSVNNDGMRKVGFTAPSVEGQAAAIKATHHIAKVAPESITYIETHGTGTPLGDPIEIEALKMAFDSDKKGFCRIGSVKTNIGHLDSAAGVAGIIKTILALKHRHIPPSLNFEEPNPKINFQDSPFRVNSQLTAWENDTYPLRAGVSSFGIGGTNAHVLLEEAPELPGSAGGREWNPVMLSAKTGTALERLSENLAEHLRKNPGINAADLRYTLTVGRGSFKHRKMVMGRDLPETIDALQKQRSAVTCSLPDDVEQKEVVFMFPGLGAQYVNMGLEIYRKESVFREEIDRCFEILEPITDFDLKQVLYPTGNTDEAQERISRIDISQLAVFVFEYALVKLLAGWGIKPRAIIGYSFGEYAAAVAAGIFTLEDALEIVAFRGRLMRELPGGLMLSVPLPAEELMPLLPPALSLAIDNGPSCVVSGTEADIEVFEKEMKAKGCICMRLQSSHAVHSSMMDPILSRFEAKVGTKTLTPPRIPFMSNVTGTWGNGAEVSSPGYWSEQLRKTVRFKDAVKELSGEPQTLFLEIGPGRDLCSLLVRHIEDIPGTHAVNLVRPPQKDISDVYYLMNRIGRCWVYGIDVDWRAFYAEEERRRIPLPLYPFEERRYRLDGAPYKPGTEKLPQTPGSATVPGVDDWYYTPSWTRSILTPHSFSTLSRETSWLIFTDASGIGTFFAQFLRKKGIDVFTVSIGSRFETSPSSGATYALNPGKAEHYDALFQQLDAEGRQPGKIVHLWGTGCRDGHTSEPAAEDSLAHHLDRGFYSLLYLAKAIVKRKKRQDVEISVVTSGMRNVTDRECLNPEKATVIGLLKVIPQEHPHIVCRGIDLELPVPGGLQEKRTLRNLRDELLTVPKDTVVALRGNHRWVQTYNPVSLKKPLKEQLPLKEEGVYLVTGGTGSIGLILARYMVEKFKARLILTGRSALPHAEERSNYLETAAVDDPVAHKLMKIRELEELGGKVLALTADVSQAREMDEVIRRGEETFGPINGVIHAAGVVGGPSFQAVRDIQKAHCEEQFRPKIRGLITLDTLLGDRELDFCWLISSISSVLGGLSFSAYAAGNTFMDAFVSKHNRESVCRWTSILWEGMEPAASLSAFERIFGLGDVDHVVVSGSGFLQERIDKWINLESLREGAGDTQDDKPANLLPRPDLMNPYRPPQNQWEEDVAGIWQKMFGYDKIGCDDDFFDLGGDSLKAITVISRIHKELNTEIPLAEFFERSTPRQLAEYMSKSEKSLLGQIEPVEKKEYYPLSSAQKRFYILQQMDLHTTSNNQSQLMGLDMNIGRERLEYAVKQLLRRHESLRTSIAVIDDQPVQRIHEDVEFFVDYHEPGEAEVGELVTNFVKPFDLKRAPFMRVALIKLAEARNILMLDMHHIVTDAVSHQIFVDEFLLLYDGRNLPELTLQYKDYSEWQNSKKERENLKKQEEFWLREMGGQLPLLELPTDFERPAIQDYEGSALPFKMGSDMTGTLRELSKSCDATLYMTLLAIFTVLMARLSGSEDILIGTPVVGRRHAELNSIIGTFINTVVLRNFPNGDKTFPQFLREVKERTLNAFENQEYQFEDLVEKVWTRRDKNRNPLFNVMFNMQTPLEKKPDEEGSREKDGGNSYELVNKIAKFDLQLFCTEIGDTLSFTLEYCTKLYKKETIEKYITYFEEIAAQVVENADGKLEDISISHGYFDQQLSVPETGFAF